MFWMTSRTGVALLATASLILATALEPRFALALILAAALLYRRESSPGSPVRHDPTNPRPGRPQPQMPRIRARRALVMGSGAVAESLAASLEEGDRFRVIGFVDERPLPGRSGWSVIGRPSELPQLLERHSVEEIFVALPPSEEERRLAQLLGSHPGIKISVVPTAYHSLMRLPDVESYGDLAVVRMGSSGAGWSRVKRALDLVFSVVLLIFLTPVMALVALATRWSSEGPALFRQERVGQGGRAFSLYKFRTMVANAEALTGPTLSSGHDDPRLTPLGKFLRRSRLDELPQLWNVLIGDMSLIGPRPERPCFVEQFGQAQPLYVERHRVRPGITGLAQVRAGYHTDARDKLRYDLLYVSHPSPWLDLEILLRTIGVMFKLCG